MHDVLRDRIVRVRRADGTVERLSLPALYASLVSDQVADFPALRPHQRHGWHAFLAQLATIAVGRAGLSDLPRSSDQWQSALRALTPMYPDNEPWHLVVDDASQPAFLQTPVPDDLGKYKRAVASPDDLDILVTAKNHDVKQTVATTGAPDDWLFALINVQTMAGFLGAGNYGVARMNGGFSSRPCLGLAPAGGGVGAHLVHDVRRMLAGRAKLLERTAPYYQPQGGLALLWLEPWDGTGALDLRDLDPYFIEVSRRVRLVVRDGVIQARTAPTKKARIEAKAAKGDLGDFWTPVDVKESKALSVSANGFNYKQLWKLLFDGKAFQAPEAMKADTRQPGEWRVVARAVAGGQGKTDGYHERTDIRFSPKVTRMLLGTRGRDDLANVAQRQIEEIEAVSHALRLAIATAASGGKPVAELGKSDRARATPYAKRLEAAADARFFTALQDRVSASDDAGRRRCRADFAGHLIGVAGDLLAEAVESVPCPTIRRYRARAKARDAFERDLYRRGDGVFADQPEVLQATGGGTT